MNEGDRLRDNGKAARKAGQVRRLSAALRENLKRRKAQVKGRQGLRESGADPAREPHDSAGFGADNPVSPSRPRLAGKH
jgi:hypothetical protein